MTESVVGVVSVSDAYVPSENKVFSYIDELFSVNKDSVQSPCSMKSYHYHNRFEVYYLLSGERYYFIKDQIYHIRPGNLVLINEYDIHCTSNVDQMAYDRIVFNFSREFLSSLIGELDTDLFYCFDHNIHVLALSLHDQRYFESLLNEMLDVYNAMDSGGDSYLKIALIHFLMQVNRRADSALPAGQDQIDHLHQTIAGIIGYVNNHFDEEITLESVSNRFFISPYYFSRTFKKMFNLNFVEYLNNVRIKEAQKLLSQTTFPVTQVSEQVGFNSLTHFGRVFKRITGISPLQYRKAHNTYLS